MLEKIVSTSQQVQSILPQYIAEQYPRFVYFMQRAFASEERQGFAQDLLQNLLKYRDFDFYKKPLVETGILFENIDLVETEFITLNDGYGFPEKEGMLLINDEIILYNYREGNKFYELTRGASGIKVLGTFVADPVERPVTLPRRHNKGDTVVNLSVMFLASMLDTIHNTFSPGINSSRVHPSINRGQMLENIKDFFQAKGSKLGIKALFKILFGENDVDVFYPGDQMIKPSESTWVESFIVRVVPVPELLADPEVEYVLPDRLINREVLLKSYNDLADPATAGTVYARAICDYASSYQFGDQTQYEFYIQKQNVQGSFEANPFTKLTRALNPPGSTDDRFDVYTITVETTLGFPESGVLFIDNECIHYESKSLNQFFGCTRGYVGVDAYHTLGSAVFGPFYIEGAFSTSTTIPELDVDRTEHFASISWPLGLVESIDIRDQGLLHLPTDEVYVNGPGRVDPRDPIMATWLENYDDKLSRQEDIINIPDMSDMSNSVSGVYFDEDYCFVGSSNLPRYKWGPFSYDKSVGPNMRRYNNTYVFPRTHKQLPNEKEEGVYSFTHKGVRSIGAFIDGVPAYSNVSPTTVVQGCITKYVIVDPGKNYANPTLLVNEMRVNENISVGPAGNIQVISTNDSTVYEGLPLPTVRITGGEGGRIGFNLDNFGRVTNTYVINGGRYYNDVPTLQLIDPNKRGKGAAFSIRVDRGTIVDVEIINPGVDYTLSTYGNVIAKGTGAEVVSKVQFYQLDRWAEVENNPMWNFDKERAFLWENTNWFKDSFGYITCPNNPFINATIPSRINTELAQRIITTNDEYILITPLGFGSKHGNVVGWAFDGCPIYRGAAYKNLKNADDGFMFMASGYVLANDRTETIPSGGNIPACSPPSVEDYPMGTFVEDYIYDPARVSQKVRLLDEEFRFIQTEDFDYLAVSRPYPENAILNKNNAVKCNTPEFPEELYPDGVWVYFCTETDQGPTFPYIIGETFQMAPITQKFDVDTVEKLEAINYNQGMNADLFEGDIVYNPNSIYKEHDLIFDYNKIDRHRNPYLTSTKEELDIRIDNTSTGSVSEIVVIDGSPESSKVGDLIVYNPFSTNGSGANGIVALVEGEEVVEAEGEDIKTNVISHHYQLLLPPGDWTFFKGQEVSTTSGAGFIVLDYDYETYIMEIYITSQKLVQPGDSFFDAKNNLVTIYEASPSWGVDEMGIQVFTPPENVDEAKIFNLNNSRNTYAEIYLASDKPDGTPAPGDLWFSDVNGRLYIYYNDGDTSQWVCTQPIGMRPLKGASDVGLGNPKTTEYVLSNPTEQNVVIINNMAPSQRNDGGPIQPGDMWWSSHSGILFLYIDQWVCTDPNATRPMDGASDETFFQLENPEIPEEQYEHPQDIIISYLAPVLPDGAVYPDGTLWWSTLTGKMYIRYTNGASSTWVITNPLGSMSTAWSGDTIIDGDGGSTPPPIKPLPELPESPLLPEGSGKSDIWFEHLVHFTPGDKLRFISGAPGTSAVEEGILEEILVTGSPACGRVIRGNTPIDLSDGTPCLNATKSKYVVTTQEEHKIRTGDTVEMANSQYEEVNGEHTVIEAGSVEPAVFTTVLDNNGGVAQVNVDDPGKGYSSNFYVTFYGGNGTGGYAYVIIDTESGGSVQNVTVVDPGVNYQEPPKVFSGTQLTNKQFMFYTSETYGEDPFVTYNTSSVSAQNKIARVDLRSGGIGYEKMPDVIGVAHRAIDSAEAVVHLNGTVIERIEVSRGGTRYIDPQCVIVDLAGNGDGAIARAVVTDDEITSVQLIDGGSGYTEPVVYFVETQGKFVSKTTDIGRIQSFKIFNPGRNISPDKSLKPELMIETKCVVRWDSYFKGSVLSPDNYGDKEQDIYMMSPNGYSDWTVLSPGYQETADQIFLPGDMVWQGTQDGSYQQVTAEVVSYEESTQILTLRQVEGFLHHNEYLYNQDGKRGMVLLEGQADTDCVVKGIASPEGFFVDDTSMISEAYAHIQDSFYYQWFSYSIASPLQQRHFDNFVEDIIHPAGFIMFADVSIRENAKVQYAGNFDPIISGEVYTVLGPDGYGINVDTILAGTQRYDGEMLLSPNQ